MVIIGAITITNTTLVSVVERTSEIGLRRALGARTRDIAGQFLCEAACVGFIGGLIGTAAGTVTVVVTAISQSWTAIMEPAITAAGPLIGGVIGLLAGLYPALNASRIQPVDALRR